ncbi:MAG: signal peptidase II [bacterium]
MNLKLPGKRLIFIIAGLLVTDQYTKHIVSENLLKYQSVVIIPNFFSLTYVENSGAAFGLLANLNPAYRTLFFAGVSLMALGAVALLYRSFPLENSLSRTAAVMIMGGALGNLIDRLRFGVVVDFLDFHWYQYHWPAFNVADAAITTGVGILLLDAFLDGRKQKVSKTVHHAP